MRAESSAIRDLVQLGGLKSRIIGAAALSASGLVGWLLFGGQYYDAAAGNQAHAQRQHHAVVAPGQVGEQLDAALPAYLNRLQRDAERLELIRVTAPGEAVPNLSFRWGDVARHHYSLDQPWDADQSLLMLDRGTPGRLFLNGRTFEPEFVRQRSGESRWHPQEPGTQILLTGQTLSLWDIRTDTATPIEIFSDYENLAFGPNKGNLSQDGRIVALLGEDASGRQITFAYDLVARQKYPNIDLSGKEIAYVTISPSGDYIVVVGRLWTDGQLRGDQTEILDLFGRRIGQPWREYGRPSHFDLGFDDLGEEVAVGVSKSAPEAWQIIKRRLRDGAVLPLSPPGAATHVSLRATANPGWAFVTFGDRVERDGWLPYHREIVAIKLDGSGEAIEVVQTHTTGKPYLAEAHGVPSPDGCAVMFASDWGIGGGPISAYVAGSPTCRATDASQRRS